jgi:twinkle protein
MISDAVVAWFRERGISVETLNRAQVASGTLKGKSYIFYDYGDNGWKARTFPEKEFTAKPGFKPDFWGLPEVLAANPDLVFIVEGENDRLALIEAGISPYQILAAPNASTGLEYAHNACQAGLGRVKRFVWCGDADEAGYRLRDHLIKIVGVARFWHVTWPDGIKDANEMLLHEGAAALHDLVMNGALPWPHEGLFRLSELPTPPPLTIWTPDIPGFEDRIRLAPRTLSVVTGQPGHGKTMLFSQLWFEIARKYDLTCCIASFETGPKPHLRRQIRTLMSGKLEIEMSEQEQAQVDAWIDAHYLFIVHQEQRPTLEWFLDLAETAVIRHGARVVQLDPWNRLEAMRLPRESETEYVLRCLRALYVFAKDMNCHMQIVAHPAKMDGGRRNLAPTLEDISGSKHWENIVDQGFVVHRPHMFEGTVQKTETAFRHLKARYEELGYPCQIMLNYDLARRKYVPLSEGLTADSFD